jgi:hypothetical protein
MNKRFYLQRLSGFNQNSSRYGSPRISVFKGISSSLTTALPSSNLREFNPNSHKLVFERLTWQPKNRPARLLPSNSNSN